jgi:hypothetical protein
VGRRTVTPVHRQCHLRRRHQLALRLPATAATDLGARIPDARNDHVSLPRPEAVVCTYGVAVRPSNSTGRNGRPGAVSGGTGCTAR